MIVTRSVALSFRRLTLTALGASFVMFVPILSGWNFFWGHLVFLIWVAGTCFFSILRSKSGALAYLSCTIFLLLFLISSLIQNQDLTGFPDTIKIFLLVFSVVVLVYSVERHTLVTVLSSALSVFPFVFLIYFLYLKTDGLFTYSGRLYDPLFGSPNVVGVFCGLALIFLFCFKERFFSLIWLFLVLFYLTVIFLGFSRAAILGVVLVFLWSSRRNIPALFSGFGVAAGIFAILFLFLASDLPGWVLQKANIISDIKETGGSNRLAIWSSVIDSLDHSPIGLIFGEGPGREVYRLEYATVHHPHNFYLFVIWAYGMIGALIFLILWSAVFFRVFLGSRRISKFSSGLFIYYSFMFIVDTHLVGGQYLTLHALFFALMLKLDVGSRDEKSLCSS